MLSRPLGGGRRLLTARGAYPGPGRDRGLVNGTHNFNSVFIVTQPFFDKNCREIFRGMDDACRVLGAVQYLFCTRSGSARTGSYL